jgi:hypothetical protein
MVVIHTIVQIVNGGTIVFFANTVKNPNIDNLDITGIGRSNGTTVTLVNDVKIHLNPSTVTIVNFYSVHWITPVVRVIRLLPILHQVGLMPILPQLPQFGILRIVTILTRIGIVPMIGMIRHLRKFPCNAQPAFQPL